MRLPQCFELYCTPVNDLELLNGRFVDPHYERGFPSLTSLIIIICFHYYQRRLVSLVLASPPHLYHMSYFFAFLFTSCFFPRKKKNLISPLEFPPAFEYLSKIKLLPARSNLSFSVFASCSSKKRSLHLSSRFFVLELLLCSRTRACCTYNLLILLFFYFFLIFFLNK